MKPNLGIINENTQAVANELSIILADEYVLYTKTRNAHWNVERADFYDKHKYFEIQYEQLDDFIDCVNERIRSLGHYAPATMQSFLELTQLTEMTREKNDSHGFIKAIG
ncbi:MAG: ferritin-like domain-containing protein [Saprospiraceae bacterium]